MKRLLPVIVAVSAPVALAFTWAGAVAPTWSAVHAASRPQASAPGAAAVASASGGVPGAASSRAGTWRLLGRAPVTRSPGDLTAVWTGREMIIHGNYGRPQGGIRGVTFAYRPATRTWARLAGGPARASAFETTDVAVWTGSRVLVPGQTSAIYSPAANTWRPMARAPMSMLGAVTRWTGHRFLAWGGTCCGDAWHDGFAYDPASNTWSKLPAAPLAVRRDASGAWTGREVVVAGGERQPRSGPNVFFRDAAAYNPATGTWRKIAPMPRRQAGATAVWDGKEVLFIGGGGRHGLFGRGLAYNPATNRWRLLPAMAYPRYGFAAVWTGRQVLVWGGLTASRIPPPHGEAYTPATGTWTALPASPLHGRAGPVAVWTGRRMIVWGGSSRTDGAAYTPAAASPWGRAIEVPGLGALNNGGDASVSQVSCASAGNCAAGGDYVDQHGKSQGFVASERHGRWGTAIAVPGLVVLNTEGDAYVNSVSCGSAGNCVAGGLYVSIPPVRGHGFVAVERNGRWGRATELPGLAALETGWDAGVLSVSCASAGNCAAGGYYIDRSDSFQGFVAVERNGAWGRAIAVPGLGALNTEGYAEVTSVSCGSAGNCAAGGFYAGHGGGWRGFVADERNGRWGTAIVVPGLGALNKGRDARVSSISCASPGNCSAGGHYTDSSGHHQGFVAVERNGRWGTAIQVPGLGALNKGRDADVTSVSCGSAGNCAAGGYYADGIVPPRPRGHLHGFVAVERNGRWGTAIQVPGLAALNKGGRDTQILTVSCASAHSCAAGGFYSDRSQNIQGFVASENNGVWRRAIQVPGLRTLNAGGSAEVGSLSCPSAGSCAAGGYYTDRSPHSQGFVTQTR